MTNPLLHDKKIAVIGGGPGGLLLARLLQRSGATVTVYERDAGRHSRVQGATLNINEGSGLDAIEAAGLSEAFRKVYRPDADGLVFTDHLGRVLLTESTHGGADRPEIDRGPLRDLLLDSLSPGTVRWDHHFASADIHADGATLRFTNGATVSADLVIGADGARSQIRPYVTPLKPLYSGITVIEGVIEDTATQLPEIYRLLNGGKICAVGNDRSLFVVLKGDGSSAFYTGHKAPANWVTDSGINFSDPEHVRRWYKDEFDLWAPIWHELFAQSSAFIPRPQYYAPPGQHCESNGSVTLIGDAAHLMPPYAGEGVNMAMQDAHDLADCLLHGNFRTFREAVVAYEKKMLPRAKASVEETLEFTALFHSSQAAGWLKSMFGANRVEIR